MTGRGGQGKGAEVNGNRKLKGTEIIFGEVNNGLSHKKKRHCEGTKNRNKKILIVKLKLINEKEGKIKKKLKKTTNCSVSLEKVLDLLLLHQIQDSLGGSQLGFFFFFSPVFLGLIYCLLQVEPRNGLTRSLGCEQ
jgi:hypothetical protein